MSFSVWSVFIPFNMLGFETGWKKMNERDDVILVLKYGEETVEIGTRLTLTSFLNFSGFISFQSSEYTLFKSSLHYEFKFEEEKKFNLELTTSNPKFPKAYFVILLDDSISNYHLRTILKLPFNGYEYYDLIMRTKKIELEKMFSSQVEISLDTPDGRYFVVPMWSLEDNSFIFHTKIDCPYGIRYSFISSLDWTTNVKVFVSIDMPFIQMELTLSSTEQWNALKNMATIAIELDGNFINAHTKYDFTSGAEVICDVRSSFSHFEHQRFAVGYENSQRKMLKAHVDIFGQANGIEFDYKFIDMKNLVVLAKLDFPFQNWTDMFIDVASQIETDALNLRAGAGINKLKVGVNLLKTKEKIIANLIFKENILNFLLEDDSSKIIRFKAVTQLFDLSMKIMIMNHGNVNLVSHLQLEVNKEMKIDCYQSSHMKRKSIMVQNILVPFHVNTTVIFDLFNELNKPGMKTIGLATQFSWDTDHFKENSLALDFSIRRCDHCGDFSLGARFPGKIPLTTRATFSSSATISSNNLEIYLGTENESDF
jgi:hypothetical protein